MEKAGDGKMGGGRGLRRWGVVMQRVFCFLLNFVPFVSLPLSRLC